MTANSIRRRVVMEPSPCGDPIITVRSGRGKKAAGRGSADGHLRDGSTAILRDGGAANDQRALELLERRTRVSLPCALYLGLADDNQRRGAVMEHVRDDPYVVPGQTAPERSHRRAASRRRIVPEQKRRAEQTGELTGAQADPGLAGVRMFGGHDPELAVEFLTDH